MIVAIKATRIDSGQEVWASMGRPGGSPSWTCSELNLSSLTWLSHAKELLRRKYKVVEDLKIVEIKLEIGGEVT